MTEPQIRKTKRAKAQAKKSEAGPGKEQTPQNHDAQDADWQRHTTLLSFILLAGGIVFAYLVCICLLCLVLPLILRRTQHSLQTSWIRGSGSRTTSSLRNQALTLQRLRDCMLMYPSGMQWSLLSRFAVLF